MAEQTSVDVLVIGAGPVGMAAASELVRHGVHCRIVDKAPQPKQYSQAGVLWPRTQEILEFMGVYDAWVPESVPWHSLTLLASGKSLGTLHLQGLASPHPWPLLVGQNVTERLLQNHLATVGCPVERPVEATQLAPDSEGVDVTLQHGQEQTEVVRARWVIGGDGAHSLVRQQANIAYEGDYYLGTEFVQADCRLRSSLPLPPHHGYAFLGSEGETIFVVPMSVDGHYRVAVGRWNRDVENQAPPTLDEIQTEFRRIGAPDAELSDPTWLTRYRSQHRKATHYREGRMFLTGDAAHIWVPVVGQGMNTGIQDAFNLAWKLASVIGGKAKPELLDSYDAERGPVAAAVIQQTDREYRAMTNPSPVFKQVAEHLLPVLLRSETIQSRVVTDASEINVSYRSSPIVEDHHGSHGPAAGDRAPDAAVVLFSSKQQIRLFDLYRSGHWTLLLLGGEGGTTAVFEQLEKIASSVGSRFHSQLDTYFVVPDVARPLALHWDGSFLMDGARFVQQAYGVTTPCLYLIRPDGYVGFRGGVETQEKLAAYLERFLIPEEVGSAAAGSSP